MPRVNIEYKDEERNEAQLALRANELLYTLKEIDEYKEHLKHTNHESQDEDVHTKTKMIIVRLELLLDKVRDLLHD